MKWFKTMLIVGATVGAGVAVRSYLRRQRVLRPFVKTTQDVVDYSAIPPQVLAAEDLTDLNSASASEFEQLGLDRESADRVIDSRPFRNKMDLLSRRILTGDVYAMMKGRVAVSNASDSVKIA